MLEEVEPISPNSANSSPQIRNEFVESWIFSNVNKYESRRGKKIKKYMEEDTEPRNRSNITSFGYLRSGNDNYSKTSSEILKYLPKRRQHFIETWIYATSEIIFSNSVEFTTTSTINIGVIFKFSIDYQDENIEYISTTFAPFTTTAHAEPPIRKNFHEHGSSIISITRLFEESLAFDYDFEYDWRFGDPLDEIVSHVFNTNLAQTQVRPLNIFLRTNFIETWISHNLSRKDIAYATSFSSIRSDFRDVWIFNNFNK
ncbi:hypothetical protein DOY81_011788 [Sarcophaga bullata]|nr:hypothetical protein DOY81_011788 [Sarcophaga bullata]